MIENHDNSDKNMALVKKNTENTASDENTTAVSSCFSSVPNNHLLCSQSTTRAFRAGGGNYYG
jgi:hypothetical protein